MSNDKLTTHGGPNRGQGRHAEPGYSKIVKLRFLNKSEEIAISKLTPRQRVEILLKHTKEQAPTVAEAIREVVKKARDKNIK